MNAIQQVKVPQKTIIYTRLSASDDELSLADQDAQSRILADVLGWGVLRTETEAKTSAWKRKKVITPDGRTTYMVVRPVWSAVMDALESGEADGLIVVDRDRACRQPIDLERLIDVHLATGALVESVTGSIHLRGSDADITMARIMVAIAWQESADKARRVTAARKRQADAGTYGGGTRLYGWTPVEGKPGQLSVVKAEARALCDMAEGVLAGRSLLAIARDPDAAGVNPVKGKRWLPETVRSTLLRERNVGTIDGKPATWAAILDQGIYDQVVTILTSPVRRTNPGSKGRWLGAGIYLCGVCGAFLYSRHESYVCKQGHVKIDRAGTDREVTFTLIQRMAQPDAADLLAAPAGNEADLGELAREAAKLRQRKAMLAGMFAAGELDPSEWKAASTVIKDKLGALDAKLQAAAARSAQAPAAALAGREDAAQLWQGMDLETQRKVLRSLVTVVVSRQGRGVRRPGWKTGDGYSWFNHERIAIEFIGEAEAAAALWDKAV
jgi:site-specific DNA recombinase